MGDLKEQFNIDWLIGNTRSVKSAAEEPIGSAALNEAFFLYSRPILEILKGAQNREMRMHELVKKVNNEIPVKNFDEFRAVINRLLEREMIEMADKDPLTGDDLIRFRT